MGIVWDEPKRQRNMAKHGFDFATLTLDFFETSTVLPGYDRRLIAVGERDGAAITVVFALHGSEAISIISMRPASRKERTTR